MGSAPSMPEPLPPPPPPPQATDPTIALARDTARRKFRLQSLRSATMATGPRGAPGSLLGQPSILGLSGQGTPKSRTATRFAGGSNPGLLSLPRVF